MNFIFAHYPGDVWAVTFLVTVVLLVIGAYGFVTWRKPVSASLLALMQIAAAVILLLLLWDPSSRVQQETERRREVMVFFDTSESMSIADGADEQTRLDAALKRFATLSGAADADVDFTIYGFAEECYAAREDSAFRRWGNRTNLDSVFAALAKRPQTAGAVVFTDGQTPYSGPASGAATGNVPVVLVGMGNVDPGRDATISVLRAPARVAVDHTYSITVEADIKSASAADATLEILSDGVPVSSEQIALDEQGTSHSVTVTMPAGEPGTRMVTARLTLPDDINPANNERHAQVQVVEEPLLRVLLYTQVASFDIGKIRQVLARDKRVRLDLGFDVLKNATQAVGGANNAGFVREEAKARAPQEGLMAGHVPLPTTAEGFNEYDLIVLGPLAQDTLQPNQLELLYDFVVHRGAGLILLPGPEPWALQQIPSADFQALLPVESGVAGPVAAGADALPRLTPEGIQQGVLDETMLRELAPATLAFYPDVRPKPAASVWLEGGGQPLVVAHRVGRGRVVFLNIRHLYRWYRADLEGGVLRALVSELLSYAGTRAGAEAQVELMAARDAADPQAVRFDAYVYDRQSEEVPDATVLLEVGDEVYRMEAGAGGRYSLRLEDLRPESIVASASAEREGEFLGETTLAAHLPASHREMDDVALNRAFLVALAERMGGKYFDAAELDDKVLEGFSAPPVVEEEQTLASAWRRWPVFLAMCGWLTALWFIRRSMGFA
jgi:hypothetical protein